MDYYKPFLVPAESGDPNVYTLYSQVVLELVDVDDDGFVYLNFDGHDMKILPGDSATVDFEFDIRVR